MPQKDGPVVNMATARRIAVACPDYLSPAERVALRDADGWDGTGPYVHPDDLPKPPSQLRRGGGGS